MTDIRLTHAQALRDTVDRVSKGEQEHLIQAAQLLEEWTAADQAIDMVRGHLDGIAQMLVLAPGPEEVKAQAFTSLIVAQALVTSTHPSKIAAMVQEAERNPHHPFVGADAPRQNGNSNGSELVKP